MTFSKTLFQKFSKFSLSLQFRLGFTSVFCCFWSFFLQGFSLHIPVRPFYPSFCWYFHISCLFMHFNLGISNLWIFEVFDDCGHIFWNLSLGFVPIMFLTWSLLENLINLEICEKSKILGLVLNPIWGFCSIWFNLMKLACWLDVIDHYFV